MSIRGARVLVAGACSPFGQRLVEAFLALGARVIAADALRTRLDELSARLRQHERLWVAECDFGELRAARKLLGDAARDEPLDAAILVLPSAADGLDAGAGLAARCERFVQALLDVPVRSARGRALIVDVQDASGVVCDARDAVLRAWVAGASRDGERQGFSVCALRVDAAHPAVLERMIALSDPERAAATGVVSVP